jgi:hypothetical protein
MSSTVPARPTNQATAGVGDEPASKSADTPLARAAQVDPPSVDRCTSPAGPIRHRVFGSGDTTF